MEAYLQPDGTMTPGHLFYLPVSFDASQLRTFWRQKRRIFLFHLIQCSPYSVYLHHLQSKIQNRTCVAFLAQHHLSLSLCSVPSLDVYSFLGRSCRTCLHAPRTMKDTRTWNLTDLPGSLSSPCRCVFLVRKVNVIIATSRNIAKIEWKNLCKIMKRRVWFEWIGRNEGPFLSSSDSDPTSPSTWCRPRISKETSPSLCALVRPHASSCQAAPGSPSGLVVRSRAQRSWCAHGHGFLREKLQTKISKGKARARREAQEIPGASFLASSPVKSCRHSLTASATRTRRLWNGAQVGSSPSLVVRVVLGHTEVTDLSYAASNPQS